jgi:bifunctional non-homologous end joining protein LigD
VHGLLEGAVRDRARGRLPCLVEEAEGGDHQGLGRRRETHEVKHDGFRVIARKTGRLVKLYSRPGNDLTSRFPLIVEALVRLRSHSCIIDGEAVACGDDGIASFELIRRWDSDQSVFMWAFGLIELDGDDMRREPLIQRKALLERALARAEPGLRCNEHLDNEDGPLVFQHACKLGLEGIVSKRWPIARRAKWISSGVTLPASNSRSTTAANRELPGTPSRAQRSAFE